MGLGEYVGMWRARRRHRRMQERYENQQRRRRDRDCGPDCDCDVCDCNPFLLGSLLSLVAIASPSRAPRRDASGPGRAGMAAIRGYQRFISPHTGITCRQVPSCSNYGLQAVRRYGLVEGSRLTAARIKRCNPSTPRGTVDQVP